MFRKFWIAAVLTAASSIATSAAAGTAEDTAMAQRIATYLKNSGQLQNYRLGVKYQDGTVELLGDVTDPGQEQIAVGLTERMAGVRQVISRLEVANPSPEAAGDEPSIDYAQSLQLASAEMKQRQPSRPQPMMRNQQLSRRNQARPNRQPLPAQRIATTAAPAGNSRPQRTAMVQMPPRPQVTTDMIQRQAPVQYVARNTGPRPANYAAAMPAGAGMAAVPAAYVPGGSPQTVSYDQGSMPGYAWPTYAAYPNYAALTYPRQYSPTAWPYIGPFYPYPQVPLGWRKVSLEWDDGWWFLDFNDCATH